MGETSSPADAGEPSSESATAAGSTSSMKNCSSLWRLALCTTGICVCYLYYGILQERLFSGSSSSSLGATFVLVTQCVTNCAVAWLWRQVDGSNKKKNSNSSSSSSSSLPLRHGLLLATAGCYVGAMSCSNEAIAYVSYPVMVLAKSCKLIPTMMVGQVVEKRLYSATEWMAALLISAGIVLFHWNRIMMMEQQHIEQQQEQPVANHSNDHDDDDDPTAAISYGMMLLAASLSLDGILASCQNFIKRPRPDSRIPSAVETMLWINLYALCFLVPLSIYAGQWQTGWDNLFFRSQQSEADNASDDSSSLVVKLLLLNATVAVGQIFIFLTITWYTPIITTTITTTRKFATILLSVYLYNHQFTTVQWTAVALVFGGLYLAILRVQHNHHHASSHDSSSQHPAAPPANKQQQQQQRGDVAVSSSSAVSAATKQKTA